MPAYNAQAFIGEAIISIINQSFPWWELIVVNDGSTDETQKIVAEHMEQDARIRLIAQNQVGSALARQAGFLEAQGDYIYFLDADDRSCPQTLERLHAALLDWPETVAAYGLVVEVDAKGQILAKQGPLIRDRTPKDLFARLIERGFLSIGSVCVRRCFLSAEDFVTSLTIGEDWLFWCRLAAKGPFIFIGSDPRVLEIRKHTTNKTGIPWATLVAGWLTANATIFADGVTMQKLSPNRQAIHRQTGKFYIYFDAIKRSWARREYGSMCLYMVKAFCTLLASPRAARHIIYHFRAEILILLRVQSQ